jgi:DNA polymerase III epsilon subunit-like protein
MDVTRENFHDVYPILKEKLLTCKFLSFDEEMTGINGTDPSQRYKKDDTPATRYQKMRSIATKYSIIQFGLCFFHDSPDGNGFVASPYNFYLFPDYGTDVVLSASSIDFLRKNNMDFGRWIGKGIPFVDTKGEEWLRKKYSMNEISPTDAATTAAADSKKLITLSRKSDLDFMETNFQLFDEFLKNPSSEIFEFQECNSYLRRYIYQQIETLYVNEVLLKRSEKGNSLCAYKISKESKTQHDLQQKLQREKDYSIAMGFRLFFNDLIASKKPIVGHNNWFDLLFMLRWFDSPLAEDFDQFREHLNSLFPLIFDTKYIESSGLISEPSLDTYLEQCYQKYLNKPSSLLISIHVDCPTFNPNDANYHNAGYDAYCTGYIFAHQIYHSNGSLQHIHNSTTDDTTAATATASPAAVTSTEFIYETACNKIFCMHSLFDVNLNPKAVSGLSKYQNQTLLRVTNFPKEVKTDTFLSIESQSNHPESLEVIWVDDFSLFLVFPGSLEPNDERILNYKKLAPSEWIFETLEDFLSPSPKNEDRMDEVASSIHRSSSPIPENSSILSRAVSAILSPFRWASNDQVSSSPPPPPFPVC